MEVRPATRDDVGALASLRLDGDPIGYRHHFNAEARAFFLSQGFEPQRERLSRVVA